LMDEALQTCGYPICGWFAADRITGGHRIRDHHRTLLR
jgi:hypothetical protein